MINSKLINFKDTLRFLLLYAFTILVVYYTPKIVSSLLFLSYLVLFFRSKKDFFWIAFFLSLIYAPGYLFNKTDVDHRLFSLLNRQITFFHLITITIILKSFFRGMKFIKPFKEIYVWITFSLVLFALGFSFGISGGQFLRNLKDFVPFAFILYLPILFNDSKSYHKAMLYLLGFGFFIFFCQIYMIVFGQHISMLFGGVIMKEGNEVLRTINSESNLVRPNYSTMIVTFNVFSSLYLYQFKTLSKIEKRYLLITLVVSLISIFLTATRGYIIASLIVIFFGLKSQTTVIYKAIIPGLLVIVLLGLTTNLYTQLELSFARFETVFAIFEGDTSAKGTLRRIDERTPIVMAQWQDSPLVGKGFSNITGQYADSHVAWPTILLQGGVVGLIIMLLLIFSLGLKIKHLPLPNKKLNFILLGLFLGFVFIHSTSYMVFSYLPGNGNILMFSFFLAYLLTLSNESRGLKQI